MSTKTWSNFWDMTSDAGFRVIGSNINSNLAALNVSLFTQTTDTGQINWTAVTKPVVANTAAGYEIYKLVDAEGTWFFKIEYGTSAAATTFSAWITIGTGSNGSGTITGITSARTQAAAPATATSTTTNYPSYACCVDGNFWMLCGVGSASAGTVQQTAFGFHRTCDSTGTNTNAGYESWVRQATLFVTFAVNIATSAALSSNAGLHCLIPYGITSSNYGTGGNNNYQVWRHDVPTPQSLTCAGIGSYVTTEAGAATTTTMAIVGATTHTFFFCGTDCTIAANGSANYSLALIYE